MPTYDYRCKACGHEFEEFQTMSEAELRKCPECKKLKLERLIGSGAGFVFKGSGYYVTDYRSKSYDEGKKADAKQGEAQKPDTQKPDTPKADSKPSKGGGESKSKGSKKSDPS